MFSTKEGKKWTRGCGYIYIYNPQLGANAINITQEAHHTRMDIRASAIQYQASYWYMEDRMQRREHGEQIY